MNIKHLKREAKKRGREKGVPHCKMLDIIAQEKGYTNWKHLLKENPKPKNNDNL